MTVRIRVFFDDRSDLHLLEDFRTEVYTECYFSELEVFLDKRDFHVGISKDSLTWQTLLYQHYIKRTYLGTTDGNFLAIVERIES